MTRFPTILGNSEEGRRLMDALKIGPNSTKIEISMPVGELVTMTVTRHLTTEDIAALAEYFETTNPEIVPLTKTTYNLKARCTMNRSLLSE